MTHLLTPSTACVDLLTWTSSVSVLVQHVTLGLLAVLGYLGTRRRGTKRWWAISSAKDAAQRTREGRV